MKDEKVFILSNRQKTDSCLFNEWMGFQTSRHRIHYFLYPLSGRTGDVAGVSLLKKEFLLKDL